MFDKILIANRGEIAVRVIKTCKKLGIKTVTVYSEADLSGLHILKADEAVLIGGPHSADSYLNKQKIIDVALSHHCQAVHPGYGFLSENADFCNMVQAAGLVFIGPPAEAITAMGDKIVSKALAKKAGVPTIPGYNKAILSLDEAIEAAEKTGYPVLLKPAAGGGGKGMRSVACKDDMEQALLACKKETINAFGDDQIFLERFIERPRHIEIQILADHHGNIIFLPERECSVQRRYQKIIEETPSVAVDSSLRQKMGEVACNFASTTGYTNAGTVEFILDSDKKFYFLEMNTRLQVEHPVTEMVTGLDLVELQLKIASGEPLEIKQKDLKCSGWSIEARICAEDTFKDFIPATGMVTRYAEPSGTGIRVDSGIHAGSMVGVYYDSMLAKVICKGETRDEAIAVITDALNGYHVEGVKTNVNFVNNLINHPAFIKGDLSTNFIEEHFHDPETFIKPKLKYLHHAAIAATLIYHNRQNLVRLSLKPMAARVGAHKEQKKEYHYIVKGGEQVFKIKLKGDQIIKIWNVCIDDTEYEVNTPLFEFYRRRLKLIINKKAHMFRLQYQGNFIRVAYCGNTNTYEIYTPREWELSAFMPEPRKLIIKNMLESPMPGLIVDIKVKKGDIIHNGQELVIVESMKMESGVPSPRDGEVAEILVKNGQAVEAGDILIKFVNQS